jgi:autotransporter translocation and assembly factor TamB
MDNDRIVLENLSGKLSGGDVTLSGIVYLKKFSIKRFYLEGDFSNVSASPSSDFNVNFDGSMLFKGDPEAQTVSGDIRINRARYKERVDWKSWLLKTKKSEKYNVGISSLEKVELNIRINGKDNIRIDNNVARATVSADMILRGTLHRPLLLGRLESTEGTVYFRNNDFRIVHASADFAETSDLNPFIQISSETDVKGYTIRMNLEGQLDHFDLALSSEPALKEIDILSLLTVGKTGGDVKGLEGGIGASEATSFVTGKLQDVIEERMSSITGLDRFQIDPYVSKTTGTIEPRLTVSKRLLGDKMALTYASAVGSTEEQIIKLEYFVSKNASLVGIRDERGLVGGDIRFRFEFK